MIPIKWLFTIFLMKFIPDIHNAINEEYLASRDIKCLGVGLNHFFLTDRMINDKLRTSLKVAISFSTLQVGLC